MRFLLIVSSLLISIGLASAATDKVLCYFGTWAYGRTGNGKVLPEDLNPNLCTHIIYAFVGVQDDGSLEILDPEFDVDEGGFRRVNDLKQINPNLKTIISVGGYTAGWNTFSAISLDPVRRANFVQTTIDFLQTYNYDGLDIDWEYPIEEDRQSYITLLQDFRNAFDQHGYLLTVAVPYNPVDAAYDVPAMSGVLDYINVMTYDFHSSWSGTTCFNAPLYCSSDESEWQRETLNTNASMLNWINAGARPEQLLLGIPFYGRSFLLADPNDHSVGAVTTGAAEGGPYTENQGTLGYNELCEFHNNAGKGYDDEVQSAYLWDGDLWVGYDDPTSIRAKVEYARNHNLAGVMIWSIETDDIKGFCGEPNGLLRAINDNLKRN